MTPIHSFQAGREARISGCFASIPDMFDTYGEPCSNCQLFEDGLWCAKGHRQKMVSIDTGHMPEVVVRRIGGCQDHKIMEGTWHGEDPVKPHQSGYGGSSTNILL